MVPIVTAYEIECYVIFDNDDQDDAQGNKRKDPLTAIGITEDQDYIGTSDWWIGEDAAICGYEFETALRGAFPTYEDRQQALYRPMGR